MASGDSVAYGGNSSHSVAGGRGLDNERYDDWEGDFDDRTATAQNGNSHRRTSHDSSMLSGDPYGERQETKSTGFFILLTTAMLGLQVGWSVELASVSPFLLSLGLSKALLALVWIAGPLSGTLVQPYVGIRSDNCRIKWGRRRPFIVGGAAATMASLLLLSWTREIVSFLASIFGIDLWKSLASPAFQIFAVAVVYILDFAINVIQAALRAFIVDATPTHQQEAANAWASRVSGVGHIVAYIVGFVELPKIMPWLGNTQFKVFVALACVVMGSTTAVSTLSVKEPDPSIFGEPEKSAGVVDFFKSLWKSIRLIPPQAAAVCIVQLWAWVGWFPFLFYTSTYIGTLYCEPYFRDNPDLSPEEIDQIWERGTRAGTLALFVFAIVTFAATIVVPLLVPPTYSTVEADPRTKSTMAAILDTRRLRIEWLTLKRAWCLSHVAFAILMWMTLFIRTPVGGSILIGLVGIPWAVTSWAPFSMIAAEISAREAERQSRRNLQASISSLTDDDDHSPGAGALLGIHNVAIAAPQVLATVGSSILFNFLQKPRGKPGDDSVGWVLRIGGLAAIGAAVACWRKVYEGPSGRGGGIGGGSGSGQLRGGKHQRVTDDESGIGSEASNRGARARRAAALAANGTLGSGPGLGLAGPSASLGGDRWREWAD